MNTGHYFKWVKMKSKHLFSPFFHSIVLSLKPGSTLPQFQRDQNGIVHYEVLAGCNGRAN